MDMDAEKLKNILDLHALFLIGDSKGRKADLSGVDFSGVDLRGADLTGADLQGANLSGANLSGAKLSKAALRWVNLSGADLTGANLSGTELRWANLSGTELSGANLSGATSSIDNRDHVKSGEYENKLAHFAHIISESSTSMDHDIAHIVHKRLWERI